MKTLSQLTDFYYKSLHPTLVELEEDRLALRKKVIFIQALLGLIALAIIYFILGASSIDLNTLLFVGFGYFAIAGVAYKLLIKGYASDFKFRVIAPLKRDRYKSQIHTFFAYKRDSLHIFRYLYINSRQSKWKRLG